MTQAGGVPANEVLDPDLPIVDCHHHLWMLPASRYLIDEYAADLASGHNVLATIYVECSAMYRRHGPEHLRPVGEAEFVAGMAAMSESGLFGPARICAGFVGAADLTLGEAVEEVIEALAAASGERLRGIRGDAPWDADPAMNASPRPLAPEGLLLDRRFREGFARLAKHGLAFDAWLYHTQLRDVCSLADAFPNATIIVDHCGGLLRLGRYNVPETYAVWRGMVAETARRPNIWMKLGGLGARRCGFPYDNRKAPPPVEELAKDWRPYIETCIELFGPERCMFEANFPVDSRAGSYRTIWNTFKYLTAGYSASERTALFSGTAKRVYRIE